MNVGRVRKGVRVLTATSAAMAVAAPGALAAGEQRVSAEKPQAAFQGKFGIGNHYGNATATVRPACLPEQSCEFTPIRVADAGALSVGVTVPQTIFGFTETLSVALLDAAGNEMARVYGDATPPVGVEPGAYTMLVRWEQGAGDYTGEVTLDPADEG